MTKRSKELQIIIESQYLPTFFNTVIEPFHVKYVGKIKHDEHNTEYLYRLKNEQELQNLIKIMK